MVESDTSSEDAPAGPGFNSSEPVPDEYDVLCDECGYSLVGIQSDRCPECGKAFEPTELPFARIPWLHRRKIGRTKAYLSTVRMVLFRPRAFAMELLRPVRISIADARLFRRATIRIASGAIVATILVYLAVATAVFLVQMPRMTNREYREVAFGLCAGSVLGSTALIALHLFFYMMTDLPVFIWKGHPSLRAQDLSPIQCYATAPLALIALAPILALATVPLPFMNISLNDDGWLIPVLEIVAWSLVGALLLVLLITTVRLMLGSGVERRRARWMTAYLPLHWLMMFFVCAACAGIVLAGEGYVIGLLAKSLKL